MWGVGGAEKLHSHPTALLVLHGMLWSLVGSAVVLEGCCSPGGDAVVPGGMLSPREGGSGLGWGRGCVGKMLSLGGAAIVLGGMLSPDGYGSGPGRNAEP